MFQCCTNKRCWSNKGKFITEDTIETTLQLYGKIVYKHNMTGTTVHTQRRRVLELIKDRSTKAVSSLAKKLK